MCADGAAWGEIVYDAATRRWWIGNDDRQSPIRFCPYCGIELPTPAMAFYPRRLCDIHETEL